MKVDVRFPKQVALTLVVVGVLAAYPLIRFASTQIVIASMVGAALSTINVLLGYLTIEYAYDRSSATFLKAVLGGMGVRMLLMLGVMALLITIVQMHAVALTVSLLFFYVVFMVLEILFVQRKVSARSHE